ncbi:hypothetical protein D3C84_824650 [compost metagenome]
MSPTSSYVARRLAQAFNYPFSEPVTAYLTEAMVVACCGFGVMHRHVKADPFGRFQDGHRLRTSDILQAEKPGPFWVLHTRSGSFYVIVSFHPHGGRQSLEAFLKLREQGVHLTPYRLQ